MVGELNIDRWRRLARTRQTMLHVSIEVDEQIVNSGASISRIAESSRLAALLAVDCGHSDRSDQAVRTHSTFQLQSGRSFNLSIGRYMS